MILILFVFFVNSFRFLAKAYLITFNINVLMKIESLISKGKSFSKSEVEDLYTLGRWHMFNKDYDKALKAFQEVIKVNPTYNVFEGLTALDQIRKCYHGLKSADYIRGREDAQVDDGLVGGLKRGMHSLPVFYYQLKSSSIDDYVREEKIAERKIGKELQDQLKKRGRKETIELFFLQAASDIDKLFARWDTSRLMKNRATLKKVIELEPENLEAYIILARSYLKSKLYDRTIYYLNLLEERAPKYYKTFNLSDLELKARSLIKEEAFQHV